MESASLFMPEELLPHLLDRKIEPQDIVSGAEPWRSHDVKTELSLIQATTDVMLSTVDNSAAEQGLTNVVNEQSINIKTEIKTEEADIGEDVMNAPQKQQAELLDADILLLSAIKAEEASCDMGSEAVQISNFRSCSVILHQLPLDGLVKKMDSKGLVHSETTSGRNRKRVMSKHIAVAEALDSSSSLEPPDLDSTEEISESDSSDLDDNLTVLDECFVSEDSEEEMEMEEDHDHPCAAPLGEVLEDSPNSAHGDFESDWCKILRDFPPPLNFISSPGLQGPLKLPPWEECRPVDFYRLFIDQETVKFMKRETNLYARQVIDKAKKSGIPLRPRSNLNSWKPVTVQEMTHFLAIVMHIGIVNKPKLIDYWSIKPMLQTTFASSLMKRDRFFHILSMFHLNNDSTYVQRGQPLHDPLHRLRPLVDHLNHVFQTTYIPDQQIAISEALYPLKGQFSFKVQMQNKLFKSGIKIYEVRESRSRYIWRFEIMCNMPGLSYEPFDVVQRLIEPLKSLGYCLYADTCFSSPVLAEDLASSNTGFVGTVKTDKVGLPGDFMKMKISKGCLDFRRFRNTIVMRWAERKWRDVAVLTTIHRPEVVTVKTRRKVTKKPTAVVDFKNHIGKIDHSDQMIRYSIIRRKSGKWWKKLAFHLLTLAMVQAHCLHEKVRKMIGKPGMSVEDFIISVGEDLAAFLAGDDNPTGAAAPNGPEMLRLQGRHFCMKLKSRKACHVCYRRLRVAGADTRTLKNRTKRTIFECSACKKPMCAAPCMQIYHTQEDYAH